MSEYPGLFSVVLHNVYIVVSLDFLVLWICAV